MNRPILLAMRVFLILAVILGQFLTFSTARAVPVFSCDSVTIIPKSECEALVALYVSTGGDNWNDHTNWLMTNNPDNWAGVKLNALHIDGLYLSRNNLVGTLPPEIGNLTKLNEFWFESNQITGSLPAEMANLTDLEFLHGRDNQLSGPIPPVLLHLPSILLIDLPNNNFSGPVPADLLQKSGLLVIDFSGNQLTGEIPAELPTPTELQFLNLADNQLSGQLPLALFNYPYINLLFLDSNQLSGSIPPEIGNLTKLTWFNLSRNQFSGSIPSEIGNLTELEYIDLAFNQFSGDVPEELVNLTQIRNYGSGLDYYGLYLDYNNLNVPDPYPSIPPTPLQTYLQAKDPDWFKTQLASATFTDAGGGLTSHDQRTQVIVPANAVTSPITLHFIPLPALSQAVDPFQFANTHFRLAALDAEDQPVRSFPFLQPITLTLNYEDEDVNLSNEEEIFLFYWDEVHHTWVDAASTCSPTSSYVRDLQNNRISVEICQLGEFALVNDGEIPLYLPMVRK